MTTKAKHSKVASVLKAIPHYVNRTTLSIALGLAATFGFVAPDTATKLRDIVLMLPGGTGDLFN